MADTEQAPDAAALLAQVRDEHLALLEQTADMLSVNQYLVQALERERDARRLSRQWAAAWKRAAKRWHDLAAETHLTTADVLTHDAAIQRGDNFATEHSRALLRVGALAGLLEQAMPVLRRVYAQYHPLGPDDRRYPDEMDMLAAVSTLADDIDAALAGTVGEGENNVRG